MNSRKVEVFELISTFAVANISLEKLDHPALKTYLQSKVSKLGTIFSSQHLRSDYLDKIFVLHRQELTDIYKNVPSLTVICDEVSDSQGRFGLQILFVPQVNKSGAKKLFLAYLIFLDTTEC